MAASVWEVDSGVWHVKVDGKFRRAYPTQAKAMAAADRINAKKPAKKVRGCRDCGRVTKQRRARCELCRDEVEARDILASLHIEMAQAITDRMPAEEIEFIRCDITDAERYLGKVLQAVEKQRESERRIEASR
jgi:hypothetical protein